MRPFTDDDLKLMKSNLARCSPEYYATRDITKALLARLEAAEEVARSADYLFRHQKTDSHIAGIARFTLLEEHVKLWHKAAGK